MSGKKKVYHSASNLDTALLEKFSSIIALDQSDVKLLKIHSFITDNAGGSLTKLLHNWSYYSTSNEHNSFTDLSTKLSKLTHLLNLGATHAKLSTSFLEARPFIINFYKDLLSNHAKVIYRALNNNRGPQTNPVLRILTNLVSYQSGTLVDELINHFDFNLAVLPKLLVPPTSAANATTTSRAIDPSRDHLSIRYNFLKFWTTLNANASPFARKDLLINNFKIMNNLWKHIAEADSLNTIFMIVDFVETSILGEQTFKKSTKCKILSENFMYKVQLLFNRVEGIQTEEQRLIEFLTKIVCDPKLGLTFVNDAPWKSFESSNTNGAVSVNNKNFRLNNKLLHILLTSLKPWESSVQLAFVMTTLESNLELVPSYMNWIVQSGGGYHDPALSSWWIGHTLLYNNILQLPLPEMSTNAHSGEELDVKLMSENIALAPMSRSALTKCISSENLIVRQFACQLIVLQLTKTAKIYGKMSSQRQEFVESVFTEIPEEFVVLAAYKEATEKEHPELLKLTLVRALSLYEQLQSSNTSQQATSAGLLKFVNSEINKIIGSANLSGLDLVMLDSFLAITSQQGSDDQDFKWWNKSNSGHSFFTSLVKLSIKNVNDSLVYKNFSILSELTSHSLVFNKDLIVSPIFSIIQAFNKIDANEDILLNLLDETISRAIRTPYKYLDLSHSKYEDLSLFVIVLVEQFKFVFQQKHSEAALQDACEWLFEFLKYLIIIGEPKSAIVSLINEQVDILKFTEIIKSRNLLSTLDFNEGTNDDAPSFLEYIISCKYTEPLSLIPLNKFDAAGLLFRLKQLVREESTDEVLIFDLTLKLGNYLNSALPEDQHIAKFVNSKTFFDGLVVHNAADFNNSAMVLVSGIISEIFQQLSMNFANTSEEFNKLAYNLFSLGLTTHSQQLTVSKFIWALDNKQVLNLIDSLPAGSLLTMLCELAVDRLLQISPEVFSKIAVAGGSHDSLVKIIKSNQVTFNESSLKKQIDVILFDLPVSENYLLSALISTYSSTIIDYLIEKSDSIRDNALLCSIGYTIASNKHIPGNQISLGPFFKQISTIALENTEKNLFDLSWVQTLTIFGKSMALGNFGDISDEIVSNAIKHIQENPRDGFTAEFADFIHSVIQSSSLCSPDMEEWLHKSVLYITKKLAISKVISKKFQAFIESMDKLVQLLPTINNSIWKIAHIAVLNTQVEVILGHKLWCKQHAFILHYVNSVLATGLKNIIESEKLLQIFVNNDSMILAKELPSHKLFDQRLESALLISNLYSIDEQRNSTTLLLNKILKFYLGSIRSDDLILKDILINIEAKLASSWVSQVQSWEMSEELTNDEIDVVGGQDRLITQGKGDGLVVTLSKNFIKNTNEQFQVLPEIFDVKDPAVNKTFVSQNYNHTIYDSEFLMMILINNEELVKFEKDVSQPTIDVKKMIESNLFQFVVNQLADDRVNRILRVILQGIYKSLVHESCNYKDKNIYKVFVSNILNTLRQPHQDIPHTVWYLHGAIVPILANPGHFLYERAFRYVLSHPVIKPNHLPMYSSVTMALSGDAELEGEDSHFKQVGWLLSNLWYAIRTTKDLNALKFSGAIEWCLNLLNSPFISFRIRYLTFKVLYKIQQINEGSDLLVTRFGILASLEQQAYTVEKVASSLSLKVYGAELVGEHLSINIDELALRLGVSVGSNKRIREWTGDDMKEFVKRVHS